MWTIGWEIMNINKVSDFIIKRFNKNFSYGIIMGSGQSIRKTSDAKIDYKEIPGFISSTVSGHAGLFSSFSVNKNHILTATGRFHYYEGYKFDEVVSLIDIFDCLGINNIIITNSSGCLNADWNLNKLMIVDKFIDTTMMVNNDIKETKLPPSNIYNKIINQCHSGTYAQVIGPTYETVSEINLLQNLGVDAVGMSTVPEIRRCIELKKDFAVICSLTNYASGIINSIPSHQEVLDNAESLNNELNRIIRLII